MGETDEYPAWALPLLVKRMLWKDYGVNIGDLEFEEVMLAMSLRSLEANREQYQADKLKR